MTTTEPAHLCLGVDPCDQCKPKQCDACKDGNHAECAMPWNREWCCCA